MGGKLTGSTVPADRSPVLVDRSAVARQLARELVGAWGSWAPTMSPDGRAVAFVSDRRGTPELWVQSDDADPTVLAVSADPVLSVHWSADGEWLACAVATDGGVRSQVWVLRPDGSQLRRVAGSREQHAHLGPWTRAGHRLAVELSPTEPAEPTVCVLIDPATGTSRRLAIGKLLTALDMSHDDRFVLLRDGTRGAQFCVVVDLEQDVDHPLLPYPATGSTDVGLFRRSPEGEELPLISYLVTDAGLPRRVLLGQPVGPDGRRGPAGVLAARENAELELLDADTDGRLLLLVWNVSGVSEVELYDTASRRGLPVIGLPGPVVSGCVLSRDGSRAVLCVEGPDLPRQLWSVDIAGARTSGAGGGIAPISRWAMHALVPGPEPAAGLVQPTLEYFDAHDGLQLTGWLYRPPGQKGPGPAMLSLHGGPESQERPTFSPQHQALVAAGITVFAPNIRGSSGFGRTFVHADDGRGRHDAIADVRSCARFLVDRGYALRDRMAVTGRSYGGYLTLAAMARFPRRFAAGVDICGMSDLLTFYRDSEPWIAAAAVSKYGDPVADRKLLHQLSPLARADRIAAPLLVVHGELDTNVPIGEAHRIVAALRALGKPVDYLELPGEGHEYRRADSRTLLIERLVDFLTEQLVLGPGHPGARPR